MACVIGILVCVWLQPTTALVVTLVAQELNPQFGFGGGDYLLVFGHEIYFRDISSVSYFTLLLLVAASRSLRASKDLHHGEVLLVVLLGTMVVLRAIASGRPLLGAVNQEGRFGLLLALGFILGASWYRDWRSSLRAAVGFAMGLLAVLGIFVVLASRASYVGSARVLVFYDSATGLVAGSIILSAATSRRRLTAREWIVVCSSAVVVTLSFRRGVWLSGGLVLAIYLVFIARSRLRLLLRLVSTMTAILVVLALMIPGFAGTVYGQVLSVFDSNSLDGANRLSNDGRINDMKAAWEAVQSSPFAGLGPNPDLSGLVVTDGPLYIHNEFLQLWVQYGVASVVLLLALLALGTKRSLRPLGGLSFNVERTAAFLVLMSPVMFMTAAFLSRTQRWPALLGIALGVLAGARSSDESQGRLDVHIGASRVV